MENPTVVFQRPGFVELEDRAIVPPAAGQVLLQTRRTLISPGTELTILAGEFAPGSAWASYARFPFVAGYSSAAEVVQIGPETTGLALGDLVAARAPHARYATVDADAVTCVFARDVTLDHIPFTTLAATVMNSVRRARVGLGESVVVFGLGLLGQLAVRLARLCGARPVVGVDLVGARLAALPEDPAVLRIDASVTDARESVAAATGGRMADVVFEVTGNSRLIPSEFALLRAQQGRFVVLSSPRGEPTPFDFHDLCNWPSHTIVGTHVASHPPVETPDNPWTITRNAELFFELVANGELELDPLITHRIDFLEACNTYRMLLEDRSQALGVVIDWDVR